MLRCPQASRLTSHRGKSEQSLQETQRVQGPEVAQDEL